MRGRILAALAAVVVASVGATTAAVGQPSHNAEPRAAALKHHSTRAACAAPAQGRVSCMAKVVNDTTFNADAIGALGTIPYSPATIKAAYGYTTSNTAGAGKTIAIVDAYNNGHVQDDLNVFSRKFGLPVCNVTNGCFKKVNQRGGTGSMPPNDPGWAIEIGLDVQWAHAMAPGAKILLVEADSSTYFDMMTAERYAVAHADYVSNSFGSSEFADELQYDASFVRTGVSVFASSGDDGTPASFPSSSPKVISVGGTSLLTTNTGAALFEAAWSLKQTASGRVIGGGGGCSKYETATLAQAFWAGGQMAFCLGKRGTPDLSLVANPDTGVAMYDSKQGGWLQIGGTSASSPMVAGHAATTGLVFSSPLVYGGTLHYRDIANGNNGAPCVVGYDLCTGKGSLLG